MDRQDERNEHVSGEMFKLNPRNHGQVSLHLINQHAIIPQY